MLSLALRTILLTKRRRALGDTTAPTITSSATGSVAENSTLAFALTANETVTWTITGGADSTTFEISGSTLRWLGDGTKDFEIPNDANTDNAYIVQVTATDLSSNATNQTVTITVTDVVEGGSAGIGDELITNGGFDDDTGWTVNGNAQIVLGQAYLGDQGESLDNISCTAAKTIVAGTYDFLCDDFNAAGGSLHVTVGGGDNIINSDGSVYSGQIVVSSVSDQTILIADPAPGFTVRIIDNASLKRSS